MTASMRLAIATLLFLGSAVAAAQPQIQHWRTDNGAEVYFVAARELPIVDVRLTFDAGGARDGNTPGLARLTNELVMAGAEGMDAGTIARQFEANGARIDNASQQDMAYLHLRSLSDPGRLAPSLSLFRDVVAAPSFPAEDFQRTREQMLVSLRQSQQSPGKTASRRFKAAIYGDHPYGTPAAGTVAGLKAATRGEVKAFYERYYAARNMVIAIVGDLERDRAERIAADLANTRPDGEPASPLPPVAAGAVGETLRVDFDTQQTHILLGQPAVRRGTADWHALYVANHILGGGGLTSRLSEEMREKRGLSYSTQSYFAPAARKGRFEIRTQVRNDKRDEALTVLRESLHAFHAEGPTADELASAKRQITGSFPLNLDSNRDILGYVAMIGFYDLPLDYLARFRDQVQSVDADAVRRAFRAHVDPDALTTLMVGPYPETRGEE
ncbi:insulinase family protein [Ectothiorhodospiraceae bacterium WFHF3C12]|nr:insulinase family protein [Ectothiorhodospiraceae bacterium WFHF3C12]